MFFGRVIRKDKINQRVDNSATLNAKSILTLCDKLYAALKAAPQKTSDEVAFLCLYDTIRKKAHLDKDDLVYCERRLAEFGALLETDAR